MAIDLNELRRLGDAEIDRLRKIHDADSAELRRMDERADVVGAENERLRAAIAKAVRLWGDSMTGDGADGETMDCLRAALAGAERGASDGGAVEHSWLLRGSIDA